MNALFFLAHLDDFSMCSLLLRANEVIVDLGAVAVDLAGYSLLNGSVDGIEYGKSISCLGLYVYLRENTDG
jgi:hypothetical protein